MHCGLHSGALYKQLRPPARPFSLCLSSSVCNASVHHWEAERGPSSRLDGLPIRCSGVTAAGGPTEWHCVAYEGLAALAPSEDAQVVMRRHQEDRGAP